MIEDQAADPYHRFFEQHSKAIDIPEKKAVFLEGALVRLLMNAQYAQRGSTPFASKLHGLKLNVSKIKRLLSEIEDKINAYDLGYRQLREAVSKYMLDAENNGWRISDDEIAFYFTLGMSLGRLFRR